MRKIILSVLIVLALIPAIPTYAESTMRELSVYLYRDYPNCVFLVSWENADKTATIQIKDPDGMTIDTNSQNTKFGKGQAVISVGAEKSGYWTVYVAGDNLGIINVSGGSKTGEATQYNAIQSFNAEVSGGYINFKWNVIAEEDIINISISATQGGNYNNRTIYSDYSASKNGTTSVSVDDMQTGLYGFSIQIYDGKRQYVLSTDEPLYVKQSNAPAKLENIKVGSIDGEMFATWDIRSNSSYMVTLYDYETLAVIKTEWVNSNYYSISLADELDKVKLSVQTTEDNAYSEFDVFEITRSIPTGTITFPGFSSTRESFVAVGVDCPADVTAGFYLDGTFLLEGASAGNYDLNLSEGIHEVVAFLEDSNGNMKTFSKRITVDQTPPVVNLNNNDTVKTNTDSFVINGSTEPNAVVAINGMEQELGTGSFMAKLALDNGVNPITVAAYDVVGNKSVKTITVECTNTLGSGWTAYIAPGVLFLLLAGWYIFLNKKPKEIKSDEKTD